MSTRSQRTFLCVAFLAAGPISAASAQTPQEVLLVSENSGKLLFLDAVAPDPSNAVIAVVALPKVSATSVAAAPNGALAFVAHSLQGGSGWVSVVDVAAVLGDTDPGNDVVTAIAIPEQPSLDGQSVANITELHVSPDSTRLAVFLASVDVFSLGIVYLIDIDPQSVSYKTIVDRQSLAANLAAGAFRPVGGELWVPNALGVGTSGAEPGINVRVIANLADATRDIANFGPSEAFSAITETRFDAAGAFATLPMAYNGNLKVMNAGTRSVVATAVFDPAAGGCSAVGNAHPQRAAISPAGDKVVATLFGNRPFTFGCGTTVSSIYGLGFADFDGVSSLSNLGSLTFVPATDGGLGGTDLRFSLADANKVFVQTSRGPHRVDVPSRAKDAHLNLGVCAGESLRDLDSVLAPVAAMRRDGTYRDSDKDGQADTRCDATPPQADLAVGVSDAVDPVLAGASLGYTISVTNGGPSTAYDLTLTATLAPGSGFVSASGAGWSCAHVAGVVTCARASLAPGPAATIALDTTAPGVPGAISAGVAIASTTQDPSLGDNAASQATAVTAYCSVAPRPAARPAPSPAFGGDTSAGFCTRPATGEILSLDFGGSSSVVNTDAARFKRLGSLVVRHDVGGRHLIAADERRHVLLFYQAAQGAGRPVGALPFPRGLSLGPDGELYLVSGQVRNSRGQWVSSVWVVPRGGGGTAGYAPKRVIDGRVPSRRLVATRALTMSTGALAAGDLLVVSQAPATIFRYPRSVAGFGAREVFLAPGAFADPPTAVAFTPTGELLVGTKGGDVLRFDGNGVRLLPDFVSGLPLAASLAVTLDAGVPKLLVGTGGSVARYSFAGDGTGTLDTTTADCGGEAGLSGGAEASTPTPAGQGVEIRPSPELTITFDDVTQGGLTTVRTLEFTDNRSTAACQALSDFFPGNPELQAALAGVSIPGHVQGFRKKLSSDAPGGSYTGPPTFILTVIDTSATFARTAEVHEQEEARLGYAPKCDDSKETDRPRTFYVPEDAAAEPPLVEGPVFTDFSTGCGSNIGRGSRFSLWLTARDTRTAPAIVSDKLANLDAALGFYAALIEDTLEADLHAAVQAAAAAHAISDPQGALAALDQLLGLVDATPGGFTPDPANVPGELVARAASVKFVIQSALPLPRAPVTRSTER